MIFNFNLVEDKFPIYANVVLCTISPIRNIL